MTTKKLGLAACLFFAFSIPFFTLKSAEVKLPNDYIAAVLTESYCVRDNEILYILEDGTVWREDLDNEENSLHLWRAGDDIAIVNPYDPSLNAYEAINLTYGDRKELFRLGKTTGKPYAIRKIAPDESQLGITTHLILDEAGHWILHYDQEDLQHQNTAISWEVGDSVLLIVDPAEDWNLYPNKEGVFKFWWDFYFLNIDRNMLIDPPCFSPLGLPYDYEQFFPQ